MNNNITKKNSGFTLIEMMVSVAIFAIVVTSGMGALTMILKTYRYSQSEKKSSDSLSFVLENMTREIRLGHNYYVNPSMDGSNSEQSNSASFKTSDGPLIGFKASDNRGYIIYYIKNQSLWKKQIKEDNVITDFPLTDNTQTIVNFARITVMNTDKDDWKQPLVWIQLFASVPNKKNDTGRVIQTLISQRDLDI